MQIRLFFQQGVKRITEHIKRDFPAITTKHVRTMLKQNPSRPLDEGVELHSGSESNGPLLDHPPPAFRIVAVPGKGMGMFAVRDIRPGELVLREAPLMTMTWDEEDDDQHAARAKALSQSSKTTFFGLHDKDASEDEPTAKGIWEVRGPMHYAVLGQPLTSSVRATPCNLASPTAAESSRLLRASTIHVDRIWSIIGQLRMSSTRILSTHLVDASRFTALRPYGAAKSSPSAMAIRTRHDQKEGQIYSRGMGSSVDAKHARTEARSARRGGFESAKSKLSCKTA